MLNCIYIWKHPRSFELWPVQVLLNKANYSYIYCYIFIIPSFKHYPNHIWNLIWGHFQYIFLILAHWQPTQKYEKHVQLRQKKKAKKSLNTCVSALYSMRAQKTHIKKRKKGNVQKNITHLELIQINDWAIFVFWFSIIV